MCYIEPRRKCDIFIYFETVENSLNQQIREINKSITTLRKEGFSWCYWFAFCTFFSITCLLFEIYSSPEIRQTDVETAGLDANFGLCRIGFSGTLRA